jgi:hypothetical protein
MEKYELKNGQVFMIIRWLDMCAVSHDGKIVYTGTYANCRRFIDVMR